MTPDLPQRRATPTRRRCKSSEVVRICSFGVRIVAPDIARASLLMRVRRRRSRLLQLRTNSIQERPPTRHDDMNIAKQFLFLFRRQVAFGSRRVIEFPLDFRPKWPTARVREDVAKFVSDGIDDKYGADRDDDGNDAGFYHKLQQPTGLTTRASASSLFSGYRLFRLSLRVQTYATIPAVVDDARQ